MSDFSYAPDGAAPNGLIRKAPAMGYAAPTTVWTASSDSTLTTGEDWNRIESSATEHWWFPTLRNLSMINSGMVRFDVWRVSLGVGAAKVDALRIPLPWIDLSFRLFG